METLLSELVASSIPENELLAPTAENDSNINATSILKRDIKLELDSLRHLKRSINAINDYEFLTDINFMLSLWKQNIRQNIFNMSTSKIDVDPRFKDEIMSAVLALQSAGKAVSVNAIAQQMTHFIVSSYNNVSFFVYKADWIKRIITTLQLTDTAFSGSKINFEKIFCYIQDKALGIENNLLLGANDLVTMTNHQPTTSSFTSSTTSSITSLTTASSSIDSKQTKLDDVDKVKIRKLYSSMNEEKMWKLKTETFVERQMERFALTCNFEHPCHSLIFDSGDKCWDEYFTEEELIEIKSYQLKKFPPLPLELKEYLQTLLKYTSLDLDTLYCKLSTVRLHPVNDSVKEWAQSTILSTIKLFMCNYIPSTDQSESDVIRKIWILLDTVFDHSTIISRSGEKSSSASSDSRNQSRTIASVDPMARKLCGRKIDMSFKSISAELGCMGCGRSDGVNTTKEMLDRLIKLPKVLKDMFISLCNFAPSLVNDLAVSGVIIMNSKFTLVTMDSPCGYVCRLSRVKPIYFSTRPSEVITYLVPILKQIYSIRLLMEQNLTLISAVPVEIDENISFEVENKVYLPLSFYCIKKTGQKRRKDDMN
ncbi:hypothetical protein G6F47_010490 [Rhizopus delemar]|nr:hypothetical protein G6F48_010343 [Rhizopus delemar]KAG1588977.1 hypothetical protein G6F47_010490 [Rhizopus delemar]KAG1634013.1 hypothetical protein G6F44_010222 [Rhizopus delemar]